MSEKQKETLEWLDELEQYAKEKQLSMRILDGIDECRQNVVSEDVNWDQMGLQIEELLDSIGKKVLPAEVKVMEGDHEVSVAEVENELKKMAQRCHSENEASVNNFEDRKNIILRNLYIKLQDITRGKAHLGELKEERSYQAFFWRAAAEYHSNITTLVRDLLQSVRNNHGQMMERMKSMFQSIKAYKHSLGSERIYQEYDTKAAALDRKIQSEIERMETGEGEIQELEHRTWETIEPIVRKLQRKRRILAWIPAAVIVCVLLIGVFSTVFTISQISGTVEELVSEEEGGISLEDAADLAERGADVIEQVTGELGKTVGSLGTTVIKIFVFLVLALLYCVYLLLLKQWCNRQISNQCGAYLNTELADFTKNNTLLSRMNDMIAAAMEEYERQYDIILNDLLAGSSFDPEREEKKAADRFAEVKSGWSRIKYK